jgi:hypothetical protein
VLLIPGPYGPSGCAILPRPEGRGLPHFRSKPTTRDQFKPYREPGDHFKAWTTLLRLPQASSLRSSCRLRRIAWSSPSLCPPEKFSSEIVRLKGSFRRRCGVALEAGSAPREKAKHFGEAGADQRSPPARSIRHCASTRTYWMPTGGKGAAGRRASTRCYASICRGNDC